jgi:hypothetical protein
MDKTGSCLSKPGFGQNEQNLFRAREEIKIV